MCYVNQGIPHFFRRIITGTPHFFWRIIAETPHFFRRIIAETPHFFRRIIAEIPHFFWRIIAETPHFFRRTAAETIGNHTKSPRTWKSRGPRCLMKKLNGMFYKLAWKVAKRWSSEWRGWVYSDYPEPRESKAKPSIRPLPKWIKPTS